LDAEKWYSVTHDQIVTAGGSSLLGYYNRSHIEALVKLYPELTLKHGNFLKFSRGWRAPGWKELAKQRKFFDNYAKSKNFNPLDAEKWYSVTHYQIIRAGGNSLLRYYNRSHIEALVKLYPELMLKKKNFVKLSKRPPRRKTFAKPRKIFEAFTKYKKLNPLDTEKWHHVPAYQIPRAVCSSSSSCR